MEIADPIPDSSGAGDNGSLGPAAAKLLLDRTCDHATWMHRYATLQVEAAKRDDDFLPPLPLRELSDEDLAMLMELEQRASRPLAILLSDDMPWTVPDGVALAGGFLSRGLAHVMRGEPAARAQPLYSDIDYFVPSEGPLDGILGAIVPPTRLVARAASCVTVVPTDNTKPLVQIVVHESAADWRRLVADFDFVHLQVAQVGNTAYASVAAVLAWRTMITTVPRTRAYKYIKSHRFGKVLAEGFTLDPESVAHLRTYTGSAPPTTECVTDAWTAHKAKALDMLAYLRNANSGLASLASDDDEGDDAERVMLEAISKGLADYSRRFTPYVVTSTTAVAVQAARGHLRERGGKFTWASQYHFDTRLEPVDDLS